MRWTGVYKTAFLALAVLCTPYFAFAYEDFCVSGAGLTGVNGTYVYDGIYDSGQGNGSHPSYFNSSGSYYLVDNTEWDFVLAQKLNSIPVAYLSTGADVSTPDLVTTWNTGLGGVAPVPVVELCATPPPGPGDDTTGTSTTATSTALDFRENLFIANVFLFFVSFIGWAYIFRPVTSPFNA